jgi:hypothetical protein
MGQLVFQANLGGAVNLVGPNISTTLSLTLPSVDGNSGQALTTNGSGVLSFATLNTASGGTGLTSFTAGDLPYYATGTALSKLGIGTSGQILTSSGTAPQWSTLSGVAVTTFSAGTTGFTPNSATSGTITLGGTLATTNGGTGLTSFTANGVVYASSTSALTTGSALTFDGTSLGVGGAAAPWISGSSGGFATRLAGGASIINAVAGDTSSTSNVGLYSGASSADNPALFFQGQLRFATTTSAAGVTGFAEQMRLTSTGLGIGTSSPGAKLDLNASGSNAQMAVQNWPTLDIGGYNASQWTQTRLYTNGNIAATLDSSGNLGLGVTPSAWSSGYKAIDINSFSAIAGDSANDGALSLLSNAYGDTSTTWKYKSALGSGAGLYKMVGNTHKWYTAPSGTAGSAISFTQALTLDASGNLLVGTTVANAKFYVSGSTATGVTARFDGSSNASNPLTQFITSDTTGNPYLAIYYTDSTSNRGSIQYNRGTGLMLFNTTSDYRAKDILGNVIDSGYVIDSVPVYIGKMKGATQERPMFIAHETPSYAHTGEKDAVDAEGNPVFQQMDASALVPVIWAEIQSLRKRLAAAGIA